MIGAEGCGPSKNGETEKKVDAIKEEKNHDADRGERHVDC